ncbi:MAG TPA: SusC/RagA family TonB-linked outer membrane protein [Prolixibacteraceae bacterium]|jgi:TonB-linked SusC/RagA family outer membrane protein
MKLIFFLILVTLSQLLAIHTYSQNTRITLTLKNTPIQNVLEEIEKNSTFLFMYDATKVNVLQKVDISCNRKSISKILNKMFINTGITYSVNNQIIALTSSSDENKTNQLLNISGRVSDSSGNSLVGVSIVQKGTMNGTHTDADGHFSIQDISDNSILQFSFIGMKKQEVTVGTNSIVNLVMEAEIFDIEEIITVGYGTQKRHDIIGSISTVKSDLMQTAYISTNFNSFLQGQAAGVSVQSTSGRLGALVDTKIRGLGSISAGINPLWIIDGIPIISDVYIENSGSAIQSPMALINQADIESIQVLKDAAATSIYGSKASNGVIMVTTKSGVMGKASINLDYSTGISDLPFHHVDFLDTKQWFRVKDEAKQAYGLGAYNMSDVYTKKVFATEFLTREQAEAINTDWLKATMQKGSFHNINLSTIGGDKAVRYFLSGNYRKDNSVMTNESLERYGLRANVDLKPKNSIEIGTKVNLSLSKGNRGKNSGNNEDGNKNGTSGGFGFVNSNSGTVPFEPVYSLSNPKLYYNPYTGNPVASSDPANMLEQLDMYRALASLYGEYHIPFIKALSARSEVSIDFIQANRDFWVSDAIRKEGSIAQDNASTAKTINYNFFLKYNRTFTNHFIDLTGGTESQRANTWYRNMQGENLIGTYQQLGTPAIWTNMFSGMVSETYLKSYFGRANYKLKNKYLAGVSLRRDGSSVFTSRYRWGNFLAFSAGWILSDEAFMEKFGKNHFFKFRGSFGQTGNSTIPGNLDVTNYESGLTYGSGSVMGLNGTLVSSIGVTNLRWESTKNLDMGIDFGFFNHRIDGSFAYYNKYVNGLLLASTLPPSSGIGSIWGNIGNLVNSGIEFSVTTYNLEVQSLKWQTTFNISYNQNQVKKLTPQVDQSGAGMVEIPFITKTGYAVREYYVADFAGIDPQTGLGQIYALDHANYDQTGETQRLKDEQGNDVLLLATNSNINSNIFHLKGKSPMPTYYGGITNKFTYKAFDLSILIIFSGGNYILDTFMRDLVNPNSTGEMLADFDQNYWKKSGDKAKYQRLDWLGNIKMEDGTLVGMGDYHSYTNQFLFKGDFVKLKTINFGYTLRTSSTKQKQFNSFRLYAAAENLYTLTKYPGWDPEGQGFVTQWDLPQLFSLSLGVSFKF